MLKQSVDKYRAQKVHLLHEKWHLKGNLLPKPVWYDVLKAHPPQRRPVALTSHDPTKFKSIDQSNNEQRWKELQSYCLGLGTVKWRTFNEQRRPGRLFSAAVREADSCRRAGWAR